MSIEELQRALVEDPFSEDIRVRYAELLFEVGRTDDALVQYELLVKQFASAVAFVGKARALLELERREEAVASYRDAQGRPGFSPVQELEELIRPIAVGPPVLGVVSSDGSVSSVRRSTSSVAPDAVRFDEIGGLEELKRSLRLQIIEPFLRPGLFAKFRKNAGGGCLLYGPPGCGKTLIARAVAGEIKGEFINVGVSDVVSMWFGESESRLAEIFEKARSSYPCVLFFDELDALAFSRSKAGSEHTRRIVNQFLTELDGVMADNQGVLVIAATNMPWDVDQAIKRSGRFSRQIFVPPPDAPARQRILELKLENLPVERVELKDLTGATEMFSGADLGHLVDLAKERVLTEILDGGSERSIRQDDLAMAARAMRPTTLDWLRTARNLVRYGGADGAYGDVERYLKTVRLI